MRINFILFSRHGIQNDFTSSLVKTPDNCEVSALEMEKQGMYLVGKAITLEKIGS